VVYNYYMVQAEADSSNYKASALVCMVHGKRADGCDVSRGEQVGKEDRRDHQDHYAGDHRSDMHEEEAVSWKADLCETESYLVEANV